MATVLDGITLPADMKWTDEFHWTPVAQQVEVTTAGSLLVEESAQLAGRPITLEAQRDDDGGYIWVDRATLVELNSLAASPLIDAILLTLHDGRTFNVRFRYGDGPPVEADPVRHIVPAIDDDVYLIKLRLMQV